MARLTGAWIGLVFYIFIGSITANAAIPKSEVANTPPSKTSQLPTQASRIRQQNGAALAPKLVNIPAGCFQMGSPENESGHSTDEGLHRVCVKGFQLAKYETTLEEFKRFVTTANYLSDAEKKCFGSGLLELRKSA